MIDRYLAGRGEERAVVLVDFEETPVLYAEADFYTVAGGDEV